MIFLNVLGSFHFQIPWNAYAYMQKAIVYSFIHFIDLTMQRETTWLWAFWNYCKKYQNNTHFTPHLSLNPWQKLLLYDVVKPELDMFYICVRLGLSRDNKCVPTLWFIKLSYTISIPYNKQKASYPKKKIKNLSFWFIFSFFEKKNNS